MIENVTPANYPRTSNDKLMTGPCNVFHQRWKFLRKSCIFEARRTQSRFVVSPSSLFIPLSNIVVQSLSNLAWLFRFEGPLSEATTNDIRVSRSFYGTEEQNRTVHGVRVLAALWSSLIKASFKDGAVALSRPDGLGTTRGILPRTGRDVIKDSSTVSRIKPTPLPRRTDADRMGPKRPPNWSSRLQATPLPLSISRASYPRLICIPFSP